MTITPVQSNARAPGWGELPPEVVEKFGVDLSFPDLLSLKATSKTWSVVISDKRLAACARAQIEANEGERLGIGWPGSLTEPQRAQIREAAQTLGLPDASDSLHVKLLLNSIAVHDRLHLASPEDAVYSELSGVQLHDSRIVGVPGDPRFISIQDGAITFVRPDGSRAAPASLAGCSLIPNTAQLPSAAQPHCAVSRCMATRSDAQLLVRHQGGGMSLYDLATDELKALPDAFTGTGACLAAVSSNGRHVAAQFRLEAGGEVRLVVHDRETGAVRTFPRQWLTQISVDDKGVALVNRVVGDDYGEGDYGMDLMGPLEQIRTWELDPGADFQVGPDGRHLIRSHVSTGDLLLQDLWGEDHIELRRHAVPPQDVVAPSVLRAFGFSHGKTMVVAAYLEASGDPTLAIFHLADPLGSESIGPSLVLPLRGAATSDQQIAVWFDPDGTAVNAAYSMPSSGQTPATGVVRLSFLAE